MWFRLFDKFSTFSGKMKMYELFRKHENLLPFSGNMKIYHLFQEFVRIQKSRKMFIAEKIGKLAIYYHSLTLIWSAIIIKYKKKKTHFLWVCNIIKQCFMFIKKCLIPLLYQAVKLKPSLHLSFRCSSR